MTFGKNTIVNQPARLSLWSLSDFRRHSSHGFKHTDIPKRPWNITWSFIAKVAQKKVAHLRILKHRLFRNTTQTHALQCKAQQFHGISSCNNAVTLQKLLLLTCGSPTIPVFRDAEEVRTNPWFCLPRPKHDVSKQYTKIPSLGNLL